MRVVESFKKWGLLAAQIVTMILFIRYAGLRGLLGLVLGMFIMAYLILSRSALLRWIIEATHSDESITELLGKGEKKHEKSEY